MFTSLQLTRFKAWKDTGTILLKPITMLLGTNSSGKSSLIQSLLLLKQTVQSPDRAMQLNLGGDEASDLFNFGGFDDVLKREADSLREFSIAFSFQQAGVGLPTVSRINHGQFSCRYRQTASGGPVIQELVIADAEQRFRAARREKGNYAVYVNDEARPRVKGPQLTPERSIALPAAAIAALSSEGAIAEDISLALRRELENINYLGPLRRRPERDYAWNRSTPGQIESDGNRAIEILLASSLERDEGQNALLQGVSYWLNKMKVAEKLEIRQFGRSARYEIRIHKDGVAANLRDVGIGVSLVLPVLTAGYFAPEGSTVILEEPEVHLHPLAQSVLAEYFVTLSQTRNIQFIIETHSEHLFRRMQTLIARKEIAADSVASLFVERKGEDAMLRTLEVDEFGRVTNWPQYFFGDALGETREQARLMFSRQQTDK